MCALLLSQSATWPNGAGRFFLNKINVFSFFKSDSNGHAFASLESDRYSSQRFHSSLSGPIRIRCGAFDLRVHCLRNREYSMGAVWRFSGEFSATFSASEAGSSQRIRYIQSSYNGCGFFPHFKCTRRSQGRYRTVAPPPACGRRASAMSVDVLDMNHRTVYDVEDDVARARGAAASEGSRVPPADRGDARTWCRLTRARHAARDGQIPCAGLPLTPSCAVQDSQ